MKFGCSASCEYICEQKSFTIWCAARVGAVAVLDGLGRRRAVSTDVRTVSGKCSKLLSACLFAHRKGPSYLHRYYNSFVYIIIYARLAFLHLASAGGSRILPSFFVPQVFSLTYSIPLALQNYTYFFFFFLVKISFFLSLAFYKTLLLLFFLFSFFILFLSLIQLLLSCHRCVLFSFV